MKINLNWTYPYRTLQPSTDRTDSKQSRRKSTKEIASQCKQHTTNKETSRIYSTKILTNQRTKGSVKPERLTRSREFLVVPEQEQRRVLSRQTNCLSHLAGRSSRFLENCLQRCVDAGPGLDISTCGASFVTTGWGRIRDRLLPDLLQADSLWHPSPGH